ncbi:MAG: MGMT family protein [Clostridia bacterium]|nr:MGMT family protein [Clostridia bacterium]
MKSTTFDRQKLYELLATIPRGRVVTYGKLAEMLGEKSWARAVGNALHKNPEGDKYPCYKVVNSKGELSHAYAFGGIDEQKRRLEAEGIVVVNGKVDLEKYLIRSAGIDHS